MPYIFFSWGRPYNVFCKELENTYYGNVAEDALAYLDLNYIRTTNSNVWLKNKSNWNNYEMQLLHWSHQLGMDGNARTDLFRSCSFWSFVFKKIFCWWTEDTNACIREEYRLHMHLNAVKVGSHSGYISIRVQPTFGRFTYITWFDRWNNTFFPMLYDKKWLSSRTLEIYY